MYAEELGHSGFTASNGWLNRWQKRHNVKIALVKLQMSVKKQFKTGGNV